LPVGYGFVEYLDEATAQRILLECDGKPIPGSNPVKKFKLNRANHSKEANQQALNSGSMATPPGQQQQQQQGYQQQYYGGYGDNYPATTTPRPASQGRRWRPPLPNPSSPVLPARIRTTT
ncbi:unnamed protein product, partial [Ixodes pacificus]